MYPTRKNKTLKYSMTSNRSLSNLNILNQFCEYFIMVDIFIKKFRK